MTGAALPSTPSTAPPASPPSPYDSPASPPTRRWRVEPPRRLSHSSLWDWQAVYYHSLGPFAFSSNVVPHFVTSNSFLAHHYAQCLHRWLTGERAGEEGGRGAGEASSPASALPPVIVELGAGHGRLSFLVLSHLLELLSASSPSSPPPPFLYVVTDSSPSLLSFLRHHPSLQPFVQRGLLDVAHFDCENPQPLRLLCSGRLLGGGDGGQRPPRLFVLANYAFNSLRADAWQLREGGRRLYEAKVALWMEGTEQEAEAARVDCDDPALIGRVAEDWTWEEATAEASPTSRYPGPLHSVFDEWRASMQREAAHCPPSSCLPPFLFPVAALHCLDFLLGLPHQRDASLLLADKVVSAVEEVRPLADAGSSPPRPPHVAKHGSVSVQLHLQPLQLLLRSHAATHGLQMHSSSSAYAQGGVKAALMAVSGASGRVSEGVVAAFQSLRYFPPDAFSGLQRGVREEAGAGPLPLPLVLALLRLSQHDCDVFHQHRHALLHHASSPAQPLSSRAVADLLVDCRQLMRRYYPLQYRPSTAASSAEGPFSPLFHSRRDVAFDLGRLCLALGGWEEARRCFECSWRDAGHHSLTAYHLSVASWELGLKAEAEQWAGRAEALGEGGPVVAEWKARVLSQQRPHAQPHSHSSLSAAPT